MPRERRCDLPGFLFHVMTRGNRRETVFRDEDDFDAFVGILRKTLVVRPVRVYAWCLMPNHLHFVLEAESAGGIGRFMHRLLTAHVRRESRVRGATGRIWQGRYKACPVQDERLFVVMRYVERNPVRARLARTCGAWRWSSAGERGAERPRVSLTRPAGWFPEDWNAWLEEPLTERDFDEIRRCTAQGRPFGDLAWAKDAGARLGIRAEPRRPGRPPRVLSLAIGTGD